MTNSHDNSARSCQPYRCGSIQVESPQIRTLRGHKQRRLANATFLTAIPAGGLLAAIFVLPEVYGYIEVRAAARDSAPSSSAPSTLSTVKPAA